MRVLILTFGTRGDVDPYIALAERLSLEGHEAFVAAPEEFRSDAEACGAGFAPMGTEMLRLVRAGMAQMAGPSDSMRLLRRMKGAMRTSLLEQWRAAQQVEPTLIVTHPKALGGLHIAQRLRIPVVASIPLPFLTPTSAFPAPFLRRSPGGVVNRRSYAINRFAALAYGGMINTFRRRVLGLGRMSRFSDYLHADDGSRLPVLYGFSEHVVPVPSDYPDTAHVTGSWHRSSSEWTPPNEVEEFLDSDEPTVYIGFGSMGFGKHAAERGHLITEAVERAGIRAVVAAGWGGLSLQEASPRILALDEAPHEHLFPRLDAVVHHGGAGTTAAGLRAGRPTLVCPVLGDQAFWGQRVSSLGAGPDPVPLRTLSVQMLTDRLRQLVTDPRFSRHAAAVGQRLQREDGTGTAVRVLENIAAHGHERGGSTPARSQRDTGPLGQA